MTVSGEEWVTCTVCFRVVRRLEDCADLHTAAQMDAEAAMMCVCGHQALVHGWEDDVCSGADGACPCSNLRYVP